MTKQEHAFCIAVHSNDAHEQMCRWVLTDVKMMTIAVKKAKVTDYSIDTVKKAYMEIHYGGSKHSYQKLALIPLGRFQFPY